MGTSECKPSVCERAKGMAGRDVCVCLCTQPLEEGALEMSE